MHHSKDYTFQANHNKKKPAYVFTLKLSDILRLNVFIAFKIILIFILEEVGYILFIPIILFFCLRSWLGICTVSRHILMQLFNVLHSINNIVIEALHSPPIFTFLVFWLFSLCSLALFPWRADYCLSNRVVIAEPYFMNMKLPRKLTFGVLHLLSEC